MASVIDTHPQRSIAIDYFTEAATSGRDPNFRALAGKLKPAVSHVTLWRYWTNEFKPALDRVPKTLATLKENNLLESNGKPTPEAAEVIAVTGQALKDLPMVGPLLERVQYAWDETKTAFMDAKKAVRTVVDPVTGIEMIVGRDFSPMAPMLNQMHKNIELLGRATQAPGFTQVAQAPAQLAVLVIPCAPGTTQAASAPFQNAVTLDIKAIK